MNSADPNQVKAAEGKAKRAEDQHLNDLRTVLITRQGRRFLWRQLSVAGIFKCEFFPDPRYAEFVNGMRNLGNMLLVEINQADPSAYQRMANEDQFERDADHG